MTSQAAIVELHKDELNFSAGHFTIFSKTEREDLHGHNYYVNAVFHVLLDDNGKEITADYDTVMTSIDEFKKFIQIFAPNCQVQINIHDFPQPVVQLNDVSMDVK